MTTQTQKPLVLFYTEINIGKYKTTKHYKCINSDFKNSIYSELLNISKDRNCAKSMPEYWVQIREGKKWIKPRLTGLFKTKYPNIYKGDIGTNNIKTNTVLIKMVPEKNGIIIYHCETYLKNTEPLIHLINNL